MPKEDAVQYMKDAATKSYLKKGQDIVDMNHKAIDAGADAIVKIDVPAEWANPEADAAKAPLEGPEALVTQVKNILNPVDTMDGDSLPVSAFLPHVDGEWELGASAYEKRGVAVNVPEWDSTKCAQCNRCAFVCPHATIRPYLLDEAEMAAAPEGFKAVDHKLSKGAYKYGLAVSPLDCMGCGVCVTICPTKSLTMKPLEEQLPEQKNFDYAVKSVSVKKDFADNSNVIKSQFKTPLLEFSGSCAGCAETSYARLITQLCGDHTYISNATGCSSIWGGPGATAPYTVNEEGHGPAWCNSLFEDNAEHGLGMRMAVKTRRAKIKADVEELVAAGVPDAVRAAAEAWFAAFDDVNASKTTGEALVEALEEAKIGAEIIARKDLLAEKTVWIFGGDGWAYDIGYGGLDHVLASGENVNVMVFDTEVYSNTGGQASKASNIGQVAQFAAAGKSIQKKSLADIAISYGYIYVAQIAMGADMNQTLKAIQEAEAYPGPSLIIGYAPCEMHSIKGGMQNCQKEMQRAVACGYWNNFRYDPRLKAEGKNPFILDSKEPTESYRDFIMNEARYSALTRSFPQRAEELFDKAEKTAEARFETLTERAKSE
jgi:pyruvate-ferredoxin/flavodoxin oxidoreductase